LASNKCETSQYVSYCLLLSKKEYEELLPQGIYVQLGRVVKDPLISRDRCIKMALEGNVGKCGFAFKKEHFAFLDMNEKGLLAKVVLPVIEISLFAFRLSSDGELLEQRGKDSIDFGVCLSYPMLFSIEGNVQRTHLFAEALFFHQMRGWIRKHSKFAQFNLGGKVLKGSFRIGNEAKVMAIEKIKPIKGLELKEC
jgi:hypothetical protein